MSSPAAGVALGPPPDIDTRELLSVLVPLADRHEFPLVLLPWEVAFADVQKQLLPLINALPHDAPIQMVIGRREDDDAQWAEHAREFAETLSRLATRLRYHPEDVDHRRSGDDALLGAAAGIGRFRAGRIRLAAQRPAREAWSAGCCCRRDRTTSVTVAAAPVPDGPVGPQQFAEVLRQHPRSMATVLKTLQPLVDYDKTRRGQLVHTLEILLNEAINTSAAARALYLNRHSLLYRIKLIEELTGLSLKNPADRFQLEVSVRVHQINEARIGSGSTE